MTDQTGVVYRLSSSGKLDTLLSNGISPNGLVLSPDEKVCTTELALPSRAASPLCNQGLTAGTVRRADEGQLGLASALAQGRHDVEGVQVL